MKKLFLKLTLLSVVGFLINSFSVYSVEDDNFVYPKTNKDHNEISLNYRVNAAVSLPLFAPSCTSKGISFLLKDPKFQSQPIDKQISILQAVLERSEGYDEQEVSMYIHNLVLQEVDKKIKGIKSDLWG